jgi:hypothetical protein
MSKAGLGNWVLKFIHTVIEAELGAALSAPYYAAPSGFWNSFGKI